MKLEKWIMLTLTCFVQCRWRSKAVANAALSMDAGAGASALSPTVSIAVRRFLEMTRFGGGRDLRTRRSGLKESTVWISAAGATIGCGCAGTLIHASAAIEAVAADSLLRFLAGLGNSSTFSHSGQMDLLCPNTAQSRSFMSSDATSKHSVLSKSDSDEESEVELPE